MVSPPRIAHFLFLLLLNLFAPTPSSANDVSFIFASLSIRNLSLLGDSYFRNGSVGLTLETGVPSSSSGTATYNLPICFYDPIANASTSFSTIFSFSITNPNPNSFGDGLTFFISTNNSTIGSTGGYLGVFDSSSATNKSIIAIEFDTMLDQGFSDPSQNHIGLDIDSPISLKTTNLEHLGIELKSGNPITVWIDYHNNQTMLGVWLANSSIKPEDPVLSVKVDLSKYFKEYMYVGFSASTEGSTEVHTIESWSFRTFGLPVPGYTPSSNPGSRSRLPVVPVARPSISTSKKVSLGPAIYGLAAFVVALVAVLVSVWNSNRNKGKEIFSMKGPRRFSYRELSSATRGFHSSMIIGNGAFGTVYKSIHRAPYAVKRSKHARENKDDFIAELSVIGYLRHKNLVQLKGWCCEKSELLLVYEFMPNRSLDRALYRPCLMLRWSQRYNVAIGVASVLTYLHQECEKQVIHRDIKSSNIMLDADFNPRLGDFGLARLMDHNKSPDSTLMAGTMGYLAPEYLQYGKATEKTDVFSYGIVMLEVCCGRRPIDRGEGKDEKLVNLVDWVWALYSEDRLIEAADRRLDGKFDEEEMMRMLLVGLSCANPNCSERPSMRRVLQVLNCEAKPVPVPKQKPLPVFTTSSLSLKDIADYSDESAISSPMYEIDIS